MSQGYISAEHLKDFGGWPFVPDAAWVNLQTIAFYHFKTLIDQKGFVAQKDGGCGVGRGSSVASKLLNFFEPTLSANEPGCDGLHWLDGTVLRYCCDVHDMCYERTGATTIRGGRSGAAGGATRATRGPHGASWTAAARASRRAWEQPADDRANRVKQVQT